MYDDDENLEEQLAYLTRNLAHEEEEPDDTGSIAKHLWHGQIKTLSDAFTPRPPRQFIVSNLIKLPSLTIVYGVPGTMKSMLLADLCGAVASGSIWLPDLKENRIGFKTIKGGCLWIDLDNGADETLGRFDAIGKTRNKLTAESPLYFVSMPSPWLDASNETRIDQLSDLIKSHDVKLVVIDNLGCVIGKSDENSADMAQVMSHFRRLVDQCGIALILIHHQRKSNGSSGRAGESLRGHSSIEASLDLALMVEREDRSSALTIKATKVRGADVDPFGALFTFTQKPDTKELSTALFYRQTVDDLGSDKSIDRAIIETIKEDSSLNKSDLVDAVKQALKGVGINRIRGRVDILEAANKIKSVTGERNAKHYTLG